MNNDTSLSAPPGRTRRIVLIGLVVLGLASAVFVVRRPLLMAAPTCMAGRWHGCYDTFNGVVFMTLVVLPLAVLVAWALARRRRAAGVTSAWRISMAEVGMVYGTVPLVWMTMMPGGEAGSVPGGVSLVPLRDLLTMGPIGIGGNLLILAALGFFAPMRFAALASVPRILALGAGCSILVETAQYVLRLDRVSSVDDVLLNAAGAALAALAALASRRWWRTTAPAASGRPRPEPEPAPAPGQGTAPAPEPGPGTADKRERGNGQAGAPSRDSTTKGTRASRMPPDLSRDGQFFFRVLPPRSKALTGSATPRTIIRGVRHVGTGSSNLISMRSRNRTPTSAMWR